MRPTFTRKSTKLFAAAAVLAFSLPGYSQASTYFVNMTELSSTQLSVAYNLPDYGSFSGTVNAGSAQPEEWNLTPVAIVGVNIFAENAVLGSTQVPTIFWQEPGDSTKWNAFSFFVQNATQGVLAFSDLTAGNISSLSQGLGILGCVSRGVAAACPVLTNGQTQTVPLLILSNNAYTVSAMDVTFTDQADVASTTPLPAALPLFATGLGALGLLGWRRKRKAAAIAA
jgi:hypothetical protein